MDVSLEDVSLADVSLAKNSLSSENVTRGAFAVILVCSGVGVYCVWKCLKVFLWPINAATKVITVPGKIAYKIVATNERDVSS